MTRTCDHCGRVIRDHRVVELHWDRDARLLCWLPTILVFRPEPYVLQLLTADVGGPRPGGHMHYFDTEQCRARFGGLLARLEGARDEVRGEFSKQYFKAIGIDASKW